MLNSITKKVTYILVAVIIVSMTAFIIYISNYLDNYIDKETNYRLNSNVTRMVQTMDTYNGALEDSAKQLYKIFALNYQSFFIIPDEKIDVNVHYYLCEPLDEKIFLSEHEDMKWVKKIELNNLKMAPGDSKIIEFLI